MGVGSNTYEAMPLKITTITAGGQQDVGPGLFIGPVNHTHTLLIDPSNFTTAEVTAQGYLKAGIPLEKDGTLLDAALDVVYGITVEPVKIAKSNSAADLTAAANTDVAVATICQVNRAIIEDELGRVLTANELAGFDLAGSTVKLLT